MKTKPNRKLEELLKTLPLDPFGAVKLAEVEPKKIERPRLQVVKQVESNDQRMDLNDERQENLKRGFLRYVDYIAKKNFDEQARKSLAAFDSPSKGARTILVESYRRVKDAEQILMLKGFHFKKSG